MREWGPLTWFCAAGLSIFACNTAAPPPLEHRGPDLQVLGTAPLAAEGLECQGELGCGVPPRAPIVLELDRYLLPSTAARQAIKLTRVGFDNLTFTSPNYDLIKGTLTFQPFHPLRPDTAYTVELLIPSDSEEEDAQREGLRAFDGAPLAEGPVPLKFSFRTQPDPDPQADAPTQETGPSCREITDIFQKSCASAGCHAPCAGDGCAPEMGLDLTGPAGLRATAIGRVAHQTETGAFAGTPLENPRRFGTQMPIIDPGRPATSYLLYKLLVNAANYETGAGRELGFPLREDAKRLAEWFTQLSPMPPGRARLSVEELSAVEQWIAFGAETHDCQ